MRIRSLWVSNFKSFRELRVDHLGNFTVLVGANASGKSNFVQIFRFLRDIANHGLVNAVSLQGGADYLANANVPPPRTLGIGLTYDPDLVLDLRETGIPVLIRIPEVAYEFSIRFPQKGGFRVCSDRLEKKLEFFEPAEKGAHKPRGEGKSILSNRNGRVTYELYRPEGVPLKESDIIPSILREERIGENSLLLESPFFGFAHRLDRFFDRIAIYNFDPRLPKNQISTTGKTDLEEDGSNLAIGLRPLLEDREKRRKLSNLIKDLLPFIEEIEVEKVSDRSLLLKLKEIYSKGTFVPASFISDGTLILIAIVVALYFENKSFIILEEPERSIHPLLIPRVVAMMKESSERKQLLVTTHHPEIVKNADPDDILLSSRDREGFSNIVRPAEKEAVKTFLRQEIGIDELFRNDLLGI